MLFVWCAFKLPADSEVQRQLRRYFPVVGQVGAVVFVPEISVRLIVQSFLVGKTELKIGVSVSGEGPVEGKQASSVGVDVKPAPLPEILKARPDKVLAFVPCERVGGLEAVRSLGVRQKGGFAELRVAGHGYIRQSCHVGVRRYKAEAVLVIEILSIKVPQGI